MRITGGCTVRWMAMGKEKKQEKDATPALLSIALYIRALTSHGLDRSKNYEGELRNQLVLCHFKQQWKFLHAVFGFLKTCSLQPKIVHWQFGSWGEPLHELLVTNNYTGLKFVCPQRSRLLRRGAVTSKSWSPQAWTSITIQTSGQTYFIYAAFHLPGKLQLRFGNKVTPNVAMSQFQFWKEVAVVPRNQTNCCYQHKLIMHFSAFYTFGHCKDLFTNRACTVLCVCLI